MRLSWKAIQRSPLIQFIIHRWLAIPPAPRRLPAHLFRAVKNFADHDTQRAAALSYYAVFSIFPLTLLAAVGISAFLGPTVAQEQIIRALQLFLPAGRSDTLDLFQDSVAQALRQGGSFGLVAFLSLLWSALGLFSNLSAALNRIFRANASRSVWKNRLIAFGMTLVLIALVIVSFITSGVLRLIDALLLTTPSIWIDIGVFFLPFGINMLIFVLIFRFVPSSEVHWDAIWPAAIFGGVGFEVAKGGFALYLANLLNFQIVYGSIATMIALLLWIYIGSSILLISAEICAELNLWLIDQQRQKMEAALYQEDGIVQLPAERGQWLALRSPVSHYDQRG